VIAPILTTARLILRAPAAEDFTAFCDYMADPVTKFVGGPVGPEIAWRMWSVIAGGWTVNGFSMFSVIERESGTWIGRIGPWAPLGWPGTEVGWGLVSAAQGQGYAVEAATATIDWAFDALGWDEVIHCIAPDNIASQKVAMKLGSTNRGPGKLPPPVDAYPVEVWGQTKAQWLERREARV